MHLGSEDTDGNDCEYDYIRCENGFNAFSVLNGCDKCGKRAKK